MPRPPRAAKPTKVGPPETVHGTRKTAMALLADRANVSEATVRGGLVIVLHDARTRTFDYMYRGLLCRVETVGPLAPKSREAHELLGNRRYE